VNRPANNHLLVFTDLDGTLLDHDTYDFSPASSALAGLQAAKVPLILCSSKTRAELEYWRGLLHIAHPFIAENGGAVIIPKNYFAKPFDYDEEREEYRSILLGANYHKLRAALIEIARETCLALAGFGDLTVAQIAALTGLPLNQAAFAQMREADEPFFIEGNPGEEEMQALERAAKFKGLRITRGGRFFHLTGDSDKGKAVRRLVPLYQAEWQQSIRTVGFGDSLNDLPLLQAVDVPILVRKKNCEADWEVWAQIKDARLTNSAGPAGWNEAVWEILNFTFKK